MDLRQHTRPRLPSLVALLTLTACGGPPPAPSPSPEAPPPARRSGTNFLAACPGAVLAEPGVGLASVLRVRNLLDEAVLVTMDRCVGHVRMLELEAGAERTVSLPSPSVRFQDGFRFHVYTGREKWEGVVVTLLREDRPEIVIQEAALTTQALPGLDATVDYERWGALLDGEEPPLPPVDGVEVARWEVGSGERTVIVVHGGPYVSHRYLRPEWDALALHSRVVFYDQRGCGESPRDGDLTRRAHLEDLRQLVEAVAPDGAVLAGTAWGATLALHFTVEHPDRVRGLVLSNVPTWPAQGPQDVAPHLAARLDSLERGEAVGEWPEAPVLGSGDAESARAADRAVFERVERCEDAYMRVARAPEPRPSVRDLARIQVPLLILQGGGAFDFGTQLSRILPHAERRVLLGANREPWAVHPDLFFEEIRVFLEGLGGGP